MSSRVSVMAEMFFLNPKFFFKKVIRHLLIKYAPAPEGEVPLKIGKHTLLVFPSRNDWWKAMYFKCCDIQVEKNIRRYLAPGGTFVDAGAGAGYFSAIASNIVGDTGQVHSFEPNPVNAKAIQRMIDANPGSNIVLNHCALGADESVHDYYIQQFDHHTAASMVKSFIADVGETISVGTCRLDAYLEQKKINEVSLIKIDVEGYEYFVLKGLEGFFRKCSRKPPLIVEITPPANSDPGYSMHEFYCYMRGHGYQAYNVFNPGRKEDIESIRGTKDVVFRAL